MFICKYEIFEPDNDEPKLLELETVEDIRPIMQKLIECEDTGGEFQHAIAFYDAEGNSFDAIVVNTDSADL